jgi:hypothetical protein
VALLPHHCAADDRDVDAAAMETKCTVTVFQEHVSVVLVPIDISP